MVVRIPARRKVVADQEVVAARRRFTGPRVERATPSEASGTREKAMRRRVAVAVAPAPRSGGAAGRRGAADSARERTPHARGRAPRRRSHVAFDLVVRGQCALRIGLSSAGEQHVGKESDEQQHRTRHAERRSAALISKSGVGEQIVPSPAAISAQGHLRVGDTGLPVALHGALVSDGNGERDDAERRESDTDDQLGGHGAKDQQCG